jgi:hypothetical protein
MQKHALLPKKFCIFCCVCIFRVIKHHKKYIAIPSVTQLAAHPLAINGYAIANVQIKVYKDPIFDPNLNASRFMAEPTIVVSEPHVFAAQPTDALLHRHSQSRIVSDRLTVKR